MLQPWILQQLEEMSKVLKKEYRAQKVIVFGSYARGEATPDSDLDILVIAPTHEKYYQRMATVLRTVRGLYHGLPLSPIVLKPEELKERRRIGDQFVEEIINQGKEL